MKRLITSDRTLKYRNQYEVLFVHIDAALAKELLAANTHNRRLRPKAKAFARDMKQGEWRFNGDAIRISRTGVLLDGQHRLHAIIESDTTQLCLVVQGLPDETQDTMDQGTRRTTSDQLLLAGYQNSTTLAAIAGILVTLDKGLSLGARGNAPTLAEEKAFIEANQHEVLQAVDVANQARGKKLPTQPAAIAAAYYLCAQKNRADADTFFLDRLIGKIGFTKGDPALALLNRFEWTRNEGKRTDASEIIRFTLTAWNHERAGRKVSRLQPPRGGWNNRNFPEAK